MTVKTLNLASSSQVKSVKNEAALNASAIKQDLPANVISIRSARKAQESARQELLDYLLWTMKHDMDPHRLYDDPIEVFRAELKNVVGIA